MYDQREEELATNKYINYMYKRVRSSLWICHEFEIDVHYPFVDE